jgi:hypothetical protein
VLSLTGFDVTFLKRDVGIRPEHLENAMNDFRTAVLLSVRALGIRYGEFNFSVANFLNYILLQNLEECLQNEEKFKTMEEERTNALEVAKKKNEERETQEKRKKVNTH